MPTGDTWRLYSSRSRRDGGWRVPPPGSLRSAPAQKPRPPGDHYGTRPFDDRLRTSVRKSLDEFGVVWGEAFRPVQRVREHSVPELGEDGAHHVSDYSSRGAKGTGGAPTHSE